MIREPQHQLYVGIHNSVVAIDTRDGNEVWRTKLGGMMLVSVLWDGVELFAASKGEAFKLDPRTGEILWHNKLKRLGTGSVIMTTTRIAAQTGSVEINHTVNAASAAAAT